MNNSKRTFITAGALIGTTPLAGKLVFAADAPGDADIGYCQDMSIHHLQALDMCRRVLGRNTGGAVQAAAAEVLENQAMEVGQMRAWLTDWGASTVPPTTVMAWMGANQGAGMPLGMMPGYATDEELAALSQESGPTLGKRWLELMRAHHDGGVTMATQASVLASTEKVIRLARFQAEAQTFEIGQYDLLLSGPYGSA